METQLPGTIGLSVARALRRYRDWQGIDPDEAPPSVVRPIGNQSNNFSVLVANSRLFVVRVNRARPEENALDPLAEQAALARAAQAGLAPALRFWEPEAGITVCDYLEPDRAAAITPEHLGQLLRRIHVLDPIPQRLALADRIRHYQAKLTRSNDGPVHAAKPTPESAMDSSLELEARDRDAVLCHNDLLPPNCLFSAGRLWAIDWEYAAMGSRWFDIAAASIGHDFDTEQETELVEAYLGRTAQSRERELLGLARNSYRGIAGLWHAVRACPRS